MSKTLVSNISGSPVTLPAPYGRLLGAGKSAVVGDNIAAVIANLGGAATINGTLTVTEVPDSNATEIYPTAEAVTAAADNVTIFVDGANGNDANTGLTAATALKTIGAAYHKFARFAFSGGKILLSLAGGGTAGGAAFTAPTGLQSYIEPTIWVGGGQAYNNSFKYRGAPMTRITPATGPASAAFDAVPATVSGNITTLHFATAAPGWTVNDFRTKNAYARITRAGTNVFFELPICANTANTVAIDTTGIVGVVLNTDTFEVVTPSVKLTGDADNFGGFSIQGYGAVEALATTGCTFERIQIDFGAVDTRGATFDRCLFTTFNSFFGENMGLVNCSIQFGAFWLASSVSDPPAPRPDPGQINTTVAMEFVVQGSSFIIGGSDSSGNGAPGYGQYLQHRNISIYDAFGAGLQVNRGFFYQRPSTALQGSGNSDVGLWARYGAQARVAGGSATTITGSGGSLKVDSGAAVAYGTGAGAFEEVAGFNGNLHRVGGSTASVPLGGMSRIFTAA